MAEGFARHYGSDVLEAASAGLAPAGIVVPETVQTMAEKDIDISGHRSTPLRLEEANQFDLVVNMSGYALPDGVCVPVREWDVPDPIGEPDPVYRKVRDQIEILVTDLIREFRTEARGHRVPPA